MNKWGVCSIVLGAIASAFGFMLLYGAVTNPYGDMFALLLIGGLLVVAGGVCGIAGGFCIDRKDHAARKLLLAASVLLLPYAFLFFFLFMVARNRAADAEKAW